MIHSTKSHKVYLTDAALTCKPTYKILSPPEDGGLHYTISLMYVIFRIFRSDLRSFK
jgi:hypothetical protein